VLTTSNRVTFRTGSSSIDGRKDRYSMPPTRPRGAVSRTVTVEERDPDR
jgi:hypothetical protein